MVIQRIQSLYLLIAVILLVLFYFIPFGFWNVDEAVSSASLPLAPLDATQQTAVLIPLTIAAILAFSAIFLFKKMGLQISFVVLSIISVLVTIGMTIYLLTDTYTDTNSAVTITPEWGGGGLLLIGAVIMLVAAYRGIVNDRKLLRSYDRLR